MGAHAAARGIPERGLAREGGKELKTDISAIQAETWQWASRNFPNAQPWEALVGLQEEVGELAHAFLKKHQGIRNTEDHDAAMRDAVADIFIWLCDFCNRNGINLGLEVSNTWAQVQERHWVAHRREKPAHDAEEALRD